MNDRATARLVGVLFIAADVAGVPALLLHQPVADSRGDLATVASGSTAVVTGALLALLMGLAVVGIAIAIYPVLRRFSERLALGYVGIRLMEATFDVFALLGWLTLVVVGREATRSGSDVMPGVGGVLLGGLDVVSYTVKPIVFSIDALLLNFVLFRTGLVPRWLSAWGLAGAATFLAFGFMNAYGLDRLMVMSAPIGLQEVALALWLIVKGFHPIPSTVENRAAPVGAGSLSAAPSPAV
jgi:hypothetical protein